MWLMWRIVLAAVTLFQRYDLQGKIKVINPWAVRRVITNPLNDAPEDRSVHCIGWKPCIIWLPYQTQCVIVPWSDKSRLAVITPLKCTAASTALTGFRALSVLADSSTKILLLLVSPWIWDPHTEPSLQRLVAEPHCVPCLYTFHPLYRSISLNAATAIRTGLTLWFTFSLLSNSHESISITGLAYSSSVCLSVCFIWACNLKTKSIGFL